MDADLEVRLARVERRCRRLMSLVGILVVGLLGVVTLGAVLPPKTPQLVDASAFRVRDADGNIRGWFGIAPNTNMFVIHGLYPNDQKGFVVNLNEKLPYVDLADPDGKELGHLPAR